jgi:hypothetical protein
VLGGREITGPDRTSIVSFSDCRSRQSSADSHSWNVARPSRKTNSYSSAEWQ